MGVKKNREFEDYGMDSGIKTRRNTYRELLTFVATWGVRSVHLRRSPRAMQAVCDCARRFLAAAISIIVMMVKGQPQTLQNLWVYNV